MQCNVGGTERVLRTVAGVTTLGAGLLAPMNRRRRAAALAMGLVELTTAATRYCPMNAVAGRSSCRPSTRLGRGLARLRRLVA